MAEKLAPLGQRPMRWHIALTYFILWLLALMNLIGGLLDVYGIRFQTAPDESLGILRVYDGSNPAFSFYAQNARFFILNGVFMLALCMFIVFVRFQLAGMKRRGPMLLMVMFGVNIVESLIYTLVLRQKVSAWVQTIPDAEEVAKNTATLSAMVNNNIVQIVLMAFVAGLTWIYYQRRKEMFTK